MIRYTGEDVTKFSLIFWNTIPTPVKSIQDLRLLPDAVVSVESGSAQEAFLNQFDFIKKKRLSSVIDIILDLKFGKSLAALLEPRVAARVKRQNPELQTLEVPLTTGFKVYGCGIALKQDNTALAEKVAESIGTMRADGTLKKLEQKWQLEE